ncbi:hypothetical protein GGR56DRAFT_675454 [Xylariaceae sp. FL0804]|nr:hypothetical protein GGR56DRAFT_675454 [Xylariaceae sp. FL0804]
MYAAARSDEEALRMHLNVSRAPDKEEKKPKTKMLLPPPLVVPLLRSLAPVPPLPPSPLSPNAPPGDFYVERLQLGLTIENFGYMVLRGMEVTSRARLAAQRPNHKAATPDCRSWCAQSRKAATFTTTADAAAGFSTGFGAGFPVDPALEAMRAVPAAAADAAAPAPADPAAADAAEAALLARSEAERYPQSRGRKTGGYPNEDLVLASVIEIVEFMRTLNKSLDRHNHPIRHNRSGENNSPFMKWMMEETALRVVFLVVCAAFVALLAFVLRAARMAEYKAQFRAMDFEALVVCQVALAEVIAERVAARDAT